MMRNYDKSVSDNRSLSRYEIEVHGELAGFSAYQRRGDLLVFTETVVDPRFRGRGIGARLVAAALADAERRELRVMPRCSFVQDFLRLQPDPRSAVEA
jgi:predicted GNAT family acetyltransferase